MKVKFKDLAGDDIAIVESKSKGNFEVQHLGNLDAQDLIETLFTQPYVTITGGEKDGEYFTEEIILNPTDKNFFQTIVDDAYQLGLAAEVL